MESLLNLPDPEPVTETAKPRLDVEERLPAPPEYSGGPDARRPLEATRDATPLSSVGEQIHLLDYVRVLYKHRAAACAVFLLVFGTILVYTLTATPQFTSRVQLLIENEEANVVSFRQVVEENRQTNDYYQTQYRILQSRALARRTLDIERLWADAAFNSRGTPAFTERATSYFTQLVGMSQQAEPRASDETDNQARVIDAYVNVLSVSPIRNSRLVDVSFQMPDPKMAARLANAHARAYIDQNLEFKFLASKEAADWLSARMTEQRSRVEDSEQALQKYREQTGAISLEDRQNIVVQRLADLNTAVTKAQNERIAKEGAYNQMRALQGDRAALDTFPAILSNSFIQQLKTDLAALQRQQAQLADKLGDRHPEMVKMRTAVEATQSKIDTEIQKVIQALRNDYEAALTNERSLQAALDQQRREAQDLNRAGIQYGSLQRDAQSNREVFQGLLQRTRETDIASDLKTNNIRVVDAGEIPRSPSSPNRRRNVVLGFLGGMLVAACVAFFLEYIDNRVKTPEEIKKHLALPFLGLVPIINNKGKNEHGVLLTGLVPHAYAEAFRTARTNVLFSSAEDGTKTVVITSTGPGEGKTTITANLAISIAQASMRVLLIDCDMRRPQLHVLFGMKQEPGLSNVIVGNAKASDAVRKSSIANLWTLSAGKIPPNPAELLGSKRFKDFLASLSQHFDWILLDSPPVMAVTDASVLAHVASGVIFVVGSEMTSIGAARSALDQLDAARAKYVGAILNRVDLARQSYYYSNYYRRDYTEYYKSEKVS